MTSYFENELDTCILVYAYYYSTAFSCGCAEGPNCSHFDEDEHADYMKNNWSREELIEASWNLHVQGRITKSQMNFIKYNVWDISVLV